ncbi:hypothetical protein ACRE_080150 [Hapsidospora chrysogenum ATCC 11550]|uniref:Uncharacterized protein n=1 Tax=Hapsidospora chrysogenum (strain ATCC 11550 / CBS 779.69 / DSM 880 / IAM 14645 / JCM 23072 / IMI 49137) TaxID=857340 RepID=A0A086SVY6_HAPC1|nr:hypothetical protein ACRE_080150 [Hapsidospora chrysogenum ATCC 11550]
MSARAAWTRQDKVKAGVWAVGFAAVIMVGSWTGATLKQDKQKEEAIRQFRETTPAEQIAVLEERRTDLLEQRATYQRKLDAFRERVRERELDKERRRDKAAASR